MSLQAGMEKAPTEYCVSLTMFQRHLDTELFISLRVASL